MQLFVWEAIVWLTSYAWCHLMRPKIVNKSHSPYVLEITPAPLKERIPYESTGVVLAKYLPNIKLENFHNSKVQELGEIMRTLISEGFGVFIVA